jgi:hypothetical protein
MRHFFFEVHVSDRMMEPMPVIRAV